MPLPDVVYLVKRSERNEELRFSLRSLANLPHRRVWIAGHKPRWVTGVGHIPVREYGNKWMSTACNLRAAAKHPEVADDLVMFNDDFFIIEPIDQVPALHRGPIGAYLERRNDRTGDYTRRLLACEKLLGPDALLYDAIHTPMPMHKPTLRQVFNEISSRALFRTVYGNRADIGGVEHRDVKVLGDGWTDGPFISTSDRAFAEREVGRRIRAMFPDPSPHERT